MINIKNMLPVYIIIASIAGIYTSISVAISILEYQQFIWVALVFGIVYILIGISALDLLTTKRYSWHTIAAQAIQIAGFSLLGYKYRFCAGAFLSVEFNFDLKELSYNLEPLNIEFILGKNINNSFFYINIIPIFIIFILTKLYDKK